MSIFVIGHQRIILTGVLPIEWREVVTASDNTLPVVDHLNTASPTCATDAPVSKNVFYVLLGHDILGI